MKASTGSPTARCCARCSTRNCEPGPNDPPSQPSPARGEGVRFFTLPNLTPSPLAGEGGEGGRLLGEETMAERHQIVIVGGGAGGLELATRLGDRYGKRGR